MVNDPISDLLIRLQNASRAGKTHVGIPHSRMKISIAKILKREGYLAGADKKNNTLTLSLLYKNGRSAISGVKRISKLSRRIYLGVRDLRPVKRGYGTLVLSTPEGVMTGKEARQKRTGGEALFEIW
ncbi:30S ribosomal protein S8 [Candidatus Adlerbacteria bacterium RIFCSPHIGHO2_01_FULL_54_23]|uniref:Small ribosomal subunit protein uS8 n=3 Tax=Candidatus Adleribacteriota TaxID=1752736 RepID=A0A1F4Y289_9BACT|nr:MAG: 30S ribosomal protein S8 [Candidatus Adlerbacteria bacterium GW2011_GWA1_54_10]KKW36177.1 MAG: 30S ribosomal protein S8 [Candidatus Adlerbacteria bacterium GW2011_GWA2_54_12]KKW37369.1 MAG: 30S ribosomal protein S8 [Candidatus Adlerbacteria bacterium GW2011_GWB1_54_7]OGC79003.1 MAG: 30S ribosomal protein S8 [Candidatus Adlerbacteria bacterium RIFCSPHIGHO2_01_FULL_54_23]OGC87443.1 MAG: 30S ribosomal protein S8 [Candidatus Adlerbacteria bacterium RIFCSPLOWO2_01_FULL_54_16]